MLVYNNKAGLLLATVLLSLTSISCSTTNKDISKSVYREVSSFDHSGYTNFAQQILEASRREDIKTLKQVFDRSNRKQIQQAIESTGSVLNYQDENGMTAVMYLAVSGNDEIVKYLLRQHFARGNKLKVNLNMPINRLPFFMYGEDDKTPSLVNQEGDTALHLATINGHEKIVGLLLKDSKVFIEKENERPYFAILGINIQNNTGRTAMMEAIIKGHIEIVREISPWADVNIQDADGMTAIMHAAQRPDNSLRDREKTLRIITLIQDRSFFNKEIPATRYPMINLKNNHGLSVLDITSEKHEDIRNALSQ